MFIGFTLYDIKNTSIAVALLFLISFHFIFFAVELFSIIFLDKNAVYIFILTKKYLKVTFYLFYKIFVYRASGMYYIFHKLE